MLGGWGVAITAVVAATKSMVDAINGMVEKGRQSYNNYETAMAKTRAQASSYAPGIDTEETVRYFELASENGVASLEHLVDTFNKLLPVIDGNVEEAKEMTLLFADMEAAGRGSADTYTQMIAAIKEKGEVEKRDLQRLERQGLPIYRELARVRGEDIEATRAAAKANKISSDEFVSALKETAKAFEGTAAALSATTEGAKASMEAAKGRAYQGAARGAGDSLKGYYAIEQKRYDALAADDKAQE